MKVLPINQNNEYSIGSVPELPPPFVPYDQLSCTEEERRLIADFTHLLADHGKFWFWMHKKELKERVKVLKDRVHVLKILEVLFSSPQLKKDIRNIYNDSFKWDLVVKDTEKKMRRAEKQGMLQQYVDDFARALGIAPNAIRIFFQTQNAEGLLRYLVKR